MIDSMEQQPPKDDQPQYDIFREESSLESLDVVEEKTPNSEPKNPVYKKPRNFRKLRKRLVLVVLSLVILAGLGTMIRLLSKNDKPAPTVVINTQSLDNGTLNQLTPASDGQTKQQLTISPDTIFKSSVTVQGSEVIVKDLSVGGKANIQSDTNIRDNLSVGKSLSIGNNLTVNGLITAASLNVGSLTLSSINLSSNLVFGGHIVPNGSEPNFKPSNAAGGGTVSVSGNDTAGTITITTGGGSVSAGELAIISFKTAYSGTPKVQLTPLNAAASGLRYYATHTASFFTVNTSTAPAVSTTYIFDYLVTQ